LIPIPDTGGTVSSILSLEKVSILTRYATDGMYFAPIIENTIFHSWYEREVRSNIAFSMLLLKPGVLLELKTGFP
jgi:hypothetical protein